jgi:tRNA (guanine37-N1)-methyltransferase
LEHQQAQQGGRRTFWDCTGNGARHAALARRHHGLAIATRLRRSDLLDPDGETLAQPRVNQLSLSENLMLICGHYKGIDQRLRDHVITLELSIGDYVLSGGELAAAVLTDALVRLVPGVIGDETSALSDSFQDGLLAPPVYTRPAEYNGWKVPDVLLSGNHAAIDEWQEAQALARTKARRPDLLEGREG